MNERASVIPTALGVLPLLFAACSFVLDPDDLRASKADADAGAAETADASDGELPGPEVVIDHSGPAHCTFEYARNLAACPMTCPSTGWTYVVDASRSRGVGSFAWTFDVSGGYTLDKLQASGARVELTVRMPDCLIGGFEVRPFTIFPRLSVDGGPFELVDLPQIALASLALCEGGEGDCPDP